MNRIYRLVWNRALHVMQVASEFATSHGGDPTDGGTPLRRRPLALACVAALGLVAFAAPAWSAASCTVDGVTYSDCTIGAAGVVGQTGTPGTDGTNVIIGSAASGTTGAASTTTTGNANGGQGGNGTSGASTGISGGDGGDGKQIDLYNTAGQTLNVWAPNGLTSTDYDGIWSVGALTWTNTNHTQGPAPMSPQPGFAIFQGVAGNVVVDNGNGDVTATGMQFAADGYIVTGDELELVGTTSQGTTTAPVINVGDGTADSAGWKAVINSKFVSQDGLTKTDYGTLVLAGNNTYIYSGVTVHGGELDLGTSAIATGVINGARGADGDNAQPPSTNPPASGKPATPGAAGGAAVTLATGTGFVNYGRANAGGGGYGGYGVAYAYGGMSGHYAPGAGGAGGIGVDAMGGTGSVTNHGSIRGGYGGAGGKYEAVGDTTVTGAAAGAGGAGVALGTGRLVNSNGATINGGDGGDTGHKYSVHLFAPSPSVSLAGAYAHGGAGGAGGAGVTTDAGATLSNAGGRIAGGYGGAGGGVLLTGAPRSGSSYDKYSANVSGTVVAQGGTGGAGGQGVGLSGQGASLTNNGIVAGGDGGSGGIAFAGDPLGGSSTTGIEAGGSLTLTQGTGGAGGVGVAVADGASLINASASADGALAGRIYGGDGGGMSGEPRPPALNGPQIEAQGDSPLQLQGPYDPAAVVASGSTGGAGGAGVTVATGGSLDNQVDARITGGGGGYGMGFQSIEWVQGDSVSGYTYALSFTRGGTGGSGGAGVVLADNPAAFSNTGTITGGDGGRAGGGGLYGQLPSNVTVEPASGANVGGDGGAGIEAGAGSFINGGGLHGGDGGKGGAAFALPGTTGMGGAGGAGLAGSGFDATNNGWIEGGTGGNGYTYLTSTSTSASGYMAVSGAGGAGVSINNATGVNTTVTNGVDGAIYGGDAGTTDASNISEGGSAPALAGGAGTNATASSQIIENAGAGGAGIGINGSGTTTITNVGDIYGGEGGYAYGCRQPQCGSYTGNGGVGGAGIRVADSGSATITNSGSITGGAGGQGYSHGVNGGAYVPGTVGTGGAGIAAIGTGSTSIDNSGSIYGGAGGFGYGSHAAAGGAGVTGHGFMLTNTGVIYGGYDGSTYVGRDKEYGVGGVGVVATGGASVTNAGLIAGGLSGKGTLIESPQLYATQADAVQAGALQADAVDFSGGGNTLTLENGYRFTGNVTSTSGTSNGGDTLALGGDSTADGGTGDGTFDTSAIVATRPTAYSGATQYYGFAQYRKTGTSTWTLTGATQAVTPWTIKAGTLSVSDDANLGAASGTLTFAGGTLENTGAFRTARSVTLTANGNFQTDADLTLSGSVTGAGALVKTGAATLTLTGANTYEGGTAIHVGTVAVGNDTALGTGTVTMDAGTTLALAADGLNLANAFALNGDPTFQVTGGTSTLSGVLADGATPGVLEKTGNGTLMLAGANTYSGGTLVSAGTLVGDTASLQGAITDNAALVFAQNADGVFDGTLSGSGSLTKAGSGALILNGDNHVFSGATEVAGGALIVGDDGFPDASLGGMVTVDSGATLGGFGTVGGIDLSGTLATGHSPGTLHTTGDVTFRKGSMWQLDALPDGTGDALDVGGTVTIAGGSVVTLAQPGSWAPRTDYTILSADGGIKGQFADVDIDLAFLSPTLTYGAHDLVLSLQRNRIDYATVAHTVNQRNTGSGAESLGFGNDVYDVVLMMNADQARHAFDQLSGEYYATALTARLHDSRYVREAMDQRLVRAGSASAGSHAAPIQGTAGSVWFHAWGHWGDRGGNGNAASLKANGSGLLVGVDAAPGGGDARIGGVIGLSQQSLRVDARGSSGHPKSTWVGVYGSAATGPVQWRAGLAYAWSRLGGNRRITVSGLAAVLGRDADGHDAQVWAEAALPFALDDGRFAPYLNVAHVKITTDAWREHGGAAALAGTGSSADATLATLGVRGAWNVGSADAPIHLHGRIGWQHAFGAGTPAVTMRMDGSAPFTVYGLPLVGHAVNVQLGLDFALGKRVDVGFGYSGEFANNLQDQGARMNVSVAF